MSHTVPHSSHWGAFSAVVEGDRLTGIRPFAGDPAPPALLAAWPAAVHSPVRVDRPYVRKSWLAGDRAGGTLRGADPFVPLDWDTAARLVAGEVARIRDTHGPASLFGGSYGWSSAGRFHHARSQLHRLLASAGGYTGQVTNYSYATGMTLLPHIIGSNDILDGAMVEWPEIVANAKTMLCFGGVTLRNGQVNSGGAGRHEMGAWLTRAAAAGVKLVNISPIRGDMPDFAGARWLPIRPGTDTALMLALAHVILSEGLEDRDFLARCTVGHDKLREYVLGQSDGVAKTPVWAAPITGLAASVIADLAREIAGAPTMMSVAWSLQRAEHGEQPYWMAVALASLLGGIGKPGQGLSFGMGSENGMGTPRSHMPAVNLPALPNPAGSFIPVARIADMLENPGGAYEYNGNHRTYPDTRLVWWAGGNPFHHHQDLNRLLRAWAKPETIIVSESWWTATARHADIVLPATTTLERNDIGSSSADRFIFAMHQAVPPVGQARSEFDYMADIADALGVRDRYTQQRDVDAWLRAMYGRARANYAQKGLEIPDFDAFWAAGSVELPRPQALHVPFAAFRADPDTVKLNTQSGRIELFSERIAGFGYAECPGHPVWQAPQEYLGNIGAYPLHLLSHQPATRLHSQMDQVGPSAASKVAGREPVAIGPADGAARGIREGDIVMISNERGACLAGARITEGLLPGVVLLATGAWFDPEHPGQPGSLCVHGNPNVLTRDQGTSRLGQGPVAQSCLVEIQRWAGPVPPVKVTMPPPIEEKTA
jgi:biotin/methionine sulfoxide reductase